MIAGPFDADTATPPTRPLTGRERIDAILGKTRPVLVTETTEREPRYVAIDGLPHRLHARDDLGVFGSARLGRIDARLAELEALADDELADEDETELAALLAPLFARFATLVLPDAPPEALARLGPGQLAALRAAWYAEEVERSGRERLRWREDYRRDLFG